MTARRIRSSILILAFVLIKVLPASAQPGPSVLANGPWVKLAITEDGLYRITPEQLQAMGWNTATLDPATLQLYGYGGGMLPQPLDTFYHQQLPENAIWVVGSDDGRFDNEDYIIFYGQSAHRLRYQPTANGYTLDYEKNLYADTAYYFLTLGQATGKRVATVASAPEAAFAVNHYDDYAVYENDLVNIRKPESGSGREWYGETFSEGQSRSFPLGLSGQVGTKEVSVTISVLGTSTAASSFAVNLNGKALGELDVEPVVDTKYAAKGSEAQTVFTTDAGSLSGDDLTVGLQYQGGRTAYLNRVWVEADRKLAYHQKALSFRSIASTQHTQSTFAIASSSDPLMVWDVTDPLVPINQEVEYDGLHWKFTTATQNLLKEFVAISPQDLPEPELIGKVTNQNLKDANVPNLVIISPPAFRAEAERLAELRRQHDGLSVQVVTPQQIYHEFSSGRQDVSAIRNYMKYLYDTDSTQLKYLLLFGKCSYDYKNYLPNNTNYVPTYESRNSLHPIFSYSSDDYYAFLEDTEGEWKESFAGDHTMDIGVGRLPVTSAEEARTVVDKLIHYATSTSTRGRWRNEVVLVADDGDNNKHQRDAEQLAQSLDTAHIDYSLTKIYLDAFPQDPLPGGEASEATNFRLERALKRGALIVNFTGHGSETRWTQENIFNVNTIAQLRNYDRLPFFVTATCEFGRYDDPTIISGAEQLVLSDRGGAIGLVTTARPVFSNSNLLLNKAFYAQVFAQENGEYLAIGEIFRRTKNNALNGRVNRNFSLLGDPSMTLAYPRDRVALTKPQVRQPDGTYLIRDTLAALDQVRLSGQILSGTDQRINTAFNGTVTVEVLDKATTARTLGSDGSAMQFEERNSVLHRGRAQVRDGRFTLDFVMPKNIVYQAGTGKITSYAQSGASDAHGADVSFLIGGSRRPSDQDQTPPQVALFMDDTTFVSGGLTGSNTALLVHLADESGISITTTSLGQDLTATLVHQESGYTLDWPLDEFYETETDTYQSGVISYPLTNLADGYYTLTLKAGDTYNNFTEAQTEFVVGAEELQISNAYNYPNPFSRETTFVIDHNRPGDDLSVYIGVVDDQGRLIRTLQQDFPGSTSRISLPWWGDEATYSDQLLRPGLYIARILVRSLTDQLGCEKFQKLIISP